MEPAQRISEDKLVHKLYWPPPPGPVSLDQLTDADRAELHDLAEGRRFVVDVGTFIGGSAEALLGGMPEDGRLITIDTFRSPPKLVTSAMSPETVLWYALGRLKQYANRLTLMVGDSVSCASLMKRRSADLVFIDAAHDYESVKADIAAWLPVVRPDGILAGHDFDKRSKGEEPDHATKLDKSSEDWDRATHVHWGVLRAVSEAFGTVRLADDDSSTVWWAKPQWVREK